MSTEVDPAPTHAFGLWGIDRDRLNEMADPVDGQRRLMTAEEVERDCQPPRQIYTAFQADSNGFQLLTNPSKPATPGEIANGLGAFLVSPPT